MIRKDLLDNACQRFFTLLLTARLRFLLKFLGSLDKLSKIIADVTKTDREGRHLSLVVPMVVAMRFVMTRQLEVWQSKKGDARRWLGSGDLSRIHGHSTSWMDR